MCINLSNLLNLHNVYSIEFVEKRDVHGLQMFLCVYLIGI